LCGCLANWVGVADVMQVAHHWFENGIAHFTQRINKCISMGVFSFFLKQRAAR
jgi:hypothetical protein